MKLCKPILIYIIIVSYRDYVNRRAAGALARPVN